MGTPHFLAAANAAAKSAAGGTYDTSLRREINKLLSREGRRR
jgi:hypothetical protein